MSAAEDDDDDEEEDEYIVEKILDVRIHKGKKEYYLKWKGWEEWVSSFNQTIFISVWLMQYVDVYR